MALKQDDFHAVSSMAVQAMAGVMVKALFIHLQEADPSIDSMEISVNIEAGDGPLADQVLVDVAVQAGTRPVMGFSL
jgi:hypothetical protein